MSWSKISEAHPKPHARYLVRREEYVFTATPCYGMHSPWWVPRSMAGGEHDPVEMKDDDEWSPLRGADPLTGDRARIKKGDRPPYMRVLPDGRVTICWRLAEERAKEEVTSDPVSVMVARGLIAVRDGKHEEVGS